MSTRGGGRGRGVGRGRSRGGGGVDTRRPGDMPQAAAPRGGGGVREQDGAQQQVGRGRGRAAATIQPPKDQSPPTTTTTGTAAPPVQKMKEVTISGPEGGGRRMERRPDDDIRTRPEHIQSKKGTYGKPTPIMANYVVLSNRPGHAIYQYNVSYNPPVDNKRMRLALLYHHEEALIGKVHSFDGMVLYLPHRLHNNPEEVISKTKEGENIHITIKLTNELSANSPVCLQLFNILFRKILSKLEMKQIGRHYYNPKIPNIIREHNLEIWPGFVTSIAQYESSVMLCADISHKILRTDTVLDLFYSLKSDPDFHNSATRSIVGEIVLTRYNNRTYRVDDIDWDKNPTSTFTIATGEEISFIDYYEKAYSLKIRDKQQPLLISRPRRKDEMEARRRGKDPASLGPLLLVPELCTMTGLTEEARANFKIMRDVATHTRQPPAQRIDTLNKFVSGINTNPDVKSILGGWNLEFEKSLLTFGGRTIPPEKIHQRGGSYTYQHAGADWSREMRGKSVISAVNLKNYLIVCTNRDSGVAEEFIRTIQKIGPPMGITVSEPQVEMLRDNRTDSFLRAITGQLKDKSTQMVIVVMPQQKKDLYDAVKKLCCCDAPVPSQCIVSRTLSKKQMLMSVATKIILQMNCKLGGELWALDIPLKNLMVVGIDTYHDSATKGRSVAAFIASTNSTLTRYYSQTISQQTGQELGDNLKVCMTNALRRYHSINNTFPDRIIVFRDGVGDGQLHVVKEHEVAQMLSAFEGFNPGFAVVVVKKRINTRLFSPDERGQPSNPLPGTVVDDEVTKPDWYDFFLVSQSVRQGTVSPTHFNVIHDTSRLSPDHMQRLTYKLTHLYYNWPGTVRVPAPCQYAHKLAFLVGQSIHKPPSPEISDRLYFL